MYTANYREIRKFMKEIDLDTPHDLHRLCIMLRNNHRNYWFSEEAVLNTLKHLKAESIYNPYINKTYYYVEGHYGITQEN